MSKRAKKNMTAKTSNGGTMTIVNNENNKGFRIDVTRGYKETPEERRERIAAGNRARRFESGKHKVKGGRAGSKQAAIRDAA